MAIILGNIDTELYVHSLQKIPNRLTNPPEANFQAHCRINLIFFPEIYIPVLSFWKSHTEVLSNVHDIHKELGDDGVVELGLY